MEPSQRILQNSFWMVFQSLLLNLLSLFVVGYIARMVGQEDYGRFIFGFSFVAMFSPFANMGLRAVTVREVAKRREGAVEFINQVLTTRLALALLSATTAVIAISLSAYPAGTKWVVYLASLTIVSQVLTTTLQDVFQAHERMKEVAYVQAVSGLALTLLSVVAMFVGMRLMGLTLAYVVGPLFGLVLIWARFVKDYPRPRLVLDVAGSRANLVKAAPFFLPSLVAMAGSNVGIVILSSVSGDRAVGYYGAANGLMERLLVIPDGVCSALFPAMTVVYSRSPKEAGRLFQQFFLYALVLGLPMAVGTTLLADRIVTLVYGGGFVDAAGVLRILSWWLFLTFLTYVESWTLGAIHREKQDGLIKVIATVVSVGLSFALIPWFGEAGAAWAVLLAAGSSFAMLSVCVTRYLAVRIADPRRVAKVLAATAVMGLVCHAVSALNVAVVIGAGALTYVGALWATGMLTAEELRIVRGFSGWKGRT